MNSYINNDFTIKLLPCLNDNYGFTLVHIPTNHIYVVDTPDGVAIKNDIIKQGYTLKGILNTHHHSDHVGGNELLVSEFNPEVYGGANDEKRIPHITHKLHDGDKIALFDGLLDTHILSLDGHTVGLIGYYMPMIKALFVGDALFNMGCGRRFEGTPQQMWQSMSKIRDLPDDTMIYAAHEYTMSNIAFVTHYFPVSDDLKVYIDMNQKLIDNHTPTIPMLLLSQKRFNPFLNADKDYVKQVTGTINQNDSVTFDVLRQMKDNF